MTTYEGIWLAGGNGHGKPFAHHEKSISGGAYMTQAIKPQRGPVEAGVVTIEHRTIIRADRKPVNVWVPVEWLDAEALYALDQLK